jgi:hypothetical protein
MRRQRPIRSIDFSGLPQARRWHIRRKGAPERLPDHLPLIKRRRVFIDGDEGSAPGAIQSMTTLASTTAMTAHLRQRLHHGVEVAPSVSYGRTSTNPASLKSPSKASASRIRLRRITAKLVASTKEYSRSGRPRSQRQASASIASST